MSKDTDSQIAAMQFMVIALIASHPDPLKLLAQFDKISSSLQVQAVAAGGGTPAALREALQSWRVQIEQAL
jgi:hypothetical protein